MIPRASRALGGTQPL